MKKSAEGFSDALLDLSAKLSLVWVKEEGDNPEGTEEYRGLFKLFPELEGLFQKGARNDPQEYSRTVAHIFHTLAVYNRLNTSSFPESGVDDSEISKLAELSESIARINPSIMPLILWLHDIGKFEGTGDHTEQSARIISEGKLLREKGLTGEEVLLITKVIQYHLLIGPLYSGEISYMSFGLLLEDEDFRPILRKEALSELFTHSLILFTMIDIWAYPYNTRAVSAFMIRDYLRIGKELKSALISGPSREETYSKLEKKAKDSTDWRLFCFMGAFTRMYSKPHLTPEFYRKKMIQGAGDFRGVDLSPEDWNEFKSGELSRFHLMQFKYALATICSLAFGSTDVFKSEWAQDHPLNPKTFDLLVSLNRKILLEEKQREISINALWNIVFVGAPNYFRKTDLIDRLNETGAIMALVENGQTGVIQEKKIHSLTLDLKPYWKYLNG
ncbi:MAG: hypothetical protein SV775_04545 [Thermodesulfobacteriota bacterium]|nr:hypothetical protein [Thermodesulfobacteriota bacterium]